MAEIRALLFDMDGLLLDTERLSKAAFDRVFAQFGLAADDDLFRSLIGLNAVAIRDRLIGVLPRDIRYESFKQAWEEDYVAATTHRVDLRPFVREALDAVHGRFPMVVATSSRRVGAERKLRAAGILDAFDHMICGDEVRQSKPAPEIFERAAALAGAHPGVCAAFEDSENGVRSAHAAGCIVVQVPDMVHPSPDLLELGHRLAPDLHSAMHTLGLLESTATPLSRA